MFFKAVKVFEIAFDNDLSGMALNERLEDGLRDKAFQPCAKAAMSSYGWVAPLGEDGTLTHSIGNYTMICAKKQEKVLPTAALNEEYDNRLATIEASQGHRMIKTEKKKLKEDIRGEMTIKAFTKSKEMYAYIDADAGHIIMNKCGKGDVEDMLDLLYETLDDVEVLPIFPQANPGAVLTSWLSNQSAGNNFRIEEWAQLQCFSENNNVVTLKDQDLFSDEVGTHIEAGKEVKAIQLCWKDLISFKVDAVLNLTGVKFHGVLVDKANEGDIDTIADQFDSDMAVMTLELTQLLSDLLGSFKTVSS